MSILADVGTQVEALPLGALLVGHCLLIALMFHFLRDKFLLNYWVGLLGAVGGGVISAYLMQDPKTPNPVFAVNAVAVIWTTCWWLINYFPLSLVAGVINLLPVRALCKACTNVLRAGTMVARIDAAVRLYPGVWAAPLILGTIAGTGGKFLVDAILTVAGINQGPVELTAPGFAWRSGAMGSVAYYLLVHVARNLTPLEGKGLITSVFIAHGLLSDVFGAPLDFTEPVARILHGIANVPMHPQGQLAAPKKVEKNGTGSGAAKSAAAPEVKKDK